MKATVTVDLRVCELLASRLCHDLAGPVAAIGNGAELLDDDDPDFVRQAATLIGDSAGTAAKRLQLFRFVYGYSAGAGAGPPPHVLATEYFAGGPVNCDYQEAVRRLDSGWQRLGCSLLIIAGEALPRGGRLALITDGDAVMAAGIGEGPGPAAEIVEALELATPIAAMTPRTVTGYIAGLIARTLGRRLRVATEPGGFRIFCEECET
jgi:histidine phosphotransferase ChpT